MDIHGTPLYMEVATIKLLLETVNMETHVTSPCASQLPIMEKLMSSAFIACNRETSPTCVENTAVCPMQKALSAVALGIPRTSAMRHRELAQKVRITVQSRHETNGTPYLAVGVATLMEASVI